MNIFIRVPLDTNPEQVQRLLDLQAAFAQVCNALAPQVQATRCWNRVALHHMAYRGLRDKFPQVGSQMVCNAIYSVSRACRLIFQQPSSAFFLGKLGSKPLPLLHFANYSPVYFDRHTLSIKKGQLSMYTLDGRMRFQVNLSPADEENFQKKKLREIVLSRTQEQGFELIFSLSDEAAAAESAPQGEMEIPEYVLVQEAA